jgi:hypothetical protein
MTWKGLGEPVIGKLRGVIDAYGEDFVIIDVSGVGYVVHCSSRTLQHLPSVGEGATLAIETHVREDMIRLRSNLHPSACETRLRQIWMRLPIVTP